MRREIGPAISSGVTVHAGPSESVWRGQPTWKSSQFPLLSRARICGGCDHLEQSGDYSITQAGVPAPVPDLCELGRHGIVFHRGVGRDACVVPGSI